MDEINLRCIGVQGKERVKKEKGAWTEFLQGITCREHALASSLLTNYMGFL